jgi:hypothetical protein
MDSPHVKKSSRAFGTELSAQTIPQAATVLPGIGMFTNPPLIPGSAGMDVVKHGHR